MLKQLSVNIPLVDALEQMQKYVKFMKDLTTKEWSVSFETLNVAYHRSSGVSNSLVQKKEDSSAFTIPCTIRVYQFNKAYGANIKLMPPAIFKKLGLGTPRPTTMRLLMADHTVKKPVGILYDVLVKVDRFLFPANFVILNCEVDSRLLYLQSTSLIFIRRIMSFNKSINIQTLGIVQCFQRIYVQQFTKV